MSANTWYNLLFKIWGIEFPLLTINHFSYSMDVGNHCMQGRFSVKNTSHMVITLAVTVVTVSLKIVEYSYLLNSFISNLSSQAWGKYCKKLVESMSYNIMNACCSVQIPFSQYRHLAKHSHIVASCVPVIVFLLPLNALELNYHSGALILPHMASDT